MSVPRRVSGREEPVGKAGAILAAAERAFLAGGFGAVTMDAIAHAAGVSKATVYAHFHGKEELFGAVIAHVSERRFHAFSGARPGFLGGRTRADARPDRSLSAPRRRGRIARHLRRPPCRRAVRRT